MDSKGLISDKEQIPEQKTTERTQQYVTSLTHSPLMYDAQGDRMLTLAKNFQANHEIVSVNNVRDAINTNLVAPLEQNFPTFPLNSTPHHPARGSTSPPHEPCLGNQGKTHTFTHEMTR